MYKPCTKGNSHMGLSDDLKFQKVFEQYRNIPKCPDFIARVFADYHAKNKTLELDDDVFKFTVKKTWHSYSCSIALRYTSDLKIELVCLGVSEIGKQYPRTAKIDCSVQSIKEELMSFLDSLPEL